VSIASLLIGFVAIISAIYASLAKRDEAAIIATSVALISLALLMFDIGAYVAAIMQISLVAGFTAAMMFLAPRLGGREPGAMPIAGIFAAIVITLTFAIISSRFTCGAPSPITRLGAVLVGLSSIIVLAAFLLVRVLLQRGDLA